MLLTAASLCFYATFGSPYLFVFLFIIALVAFGSGKLISSADSPASKRLLFWMGVTSLVATLAIARYLPYLFPDLTNTILSFDFGGLLQPSSLWMTIGVSYLMIQAISYLTDVYLGFESAESHFGFFLLYLCFFPKLLQGPIERVGQLMPQLRSAIDITPENVRSGLVLFFWGVFKKVVIADRMDMFVGAVYGDVHRFQGISLILATYCYAIQLYFDFAGYTDMVRGVAQIFNISLTENFNRPYFARSVIEFWRRWHMSLSRFILDYLFKPLQISLRRWGKFAIPAALLLTFFVSGLWHGVGWGFVVWGLLHGLFMSIAVLWKPMQRRIYKRLGLEKSRILGAWQVLVTFNAVCFAWVFFRADSLADAWYVIANCFNFSGLTMNALTSKEAIREIFLFGNGFDEPLIIALGSLIYLAVIVVARGGNSSTLAQRLSQRHMVVRWCVYYAIILGVCFLGKYGTSAFMYMKF